MSTVESGVPESMRIWMRYEPFLALPIDVAHSLILGEGVSEQEGFHSI